MKDMDGYLKKRLYPSENEPQKDSFNFDKNHLHSEEINQIKEIFKTYPDCVSTPLNPLGRFKLFQSGIFLVPGKNAARAKRNIAWHKAKPDIERLVKLGVIETNLSDNVDNIANIVLVSKSQRLTKGDKAEEKKRQREGKKEVKEERDVTKDKEKARRK